MNKAEIKKKFNLILSTAFGTKDNYKFSKSLKTGDNINEQIWDSIKNLEVLIEVEKEFEIDIDEKYILDLKSYETYIEVIKKYVS